MAAKSALKLEERLTAEDGRSSGPPEKKLRWLLGTRELVKALRDQVVEKIPAA